MRNLSEPDIEKYRLVTKYGSSGAPKGGAFEIPYGRAGSWLRIIASNGGGWDHVSVSLVDRCPTWFEMEFVKRLFFKPDETAWQYHVPPSDHVNRHPYVLHIWRKHGFKMPMPPKDLV